MASRKFVSTMRLLLPPLFCAVVAFSQSVASTDSANRLAEDDTQQASEKGTFVVSTCNCFQYFADSAAHSTQATRHPQMPDLEARESPAPRSNPGERSSVPPLIERLPAPKPADFNRDIYYRNKLE